MNSFKNVNDKWTLTFPMMIILCNYFLRPKSMPGRGSTSVWIWFQLWIWIQSRCWRRTRSWTWTRSRHPGTDPTDCTGQGNQVRFTNELRSFGHLSLPRHIKWSSCEIRFKPTVYFAQDAQVRQCRHENCVIYQRLSETAEKSSNRRTVEWLSIEQCL